MKRLVSGVFRSYKRFVSPLLPRACRFVPTCSEYAAEAVDRHGVLMGALLAIWRLIRCNPFNAGGYDPVPGVACASGLPGHKSQEDVSPRPEPIADC